MEPEEDVEEMATPLSPVSQEEVGSTEDNKAGDNTEIPIMNGEEAYQVLHGEIEDFNGLYVYAVMHTTIPRLVSIYPEEEELDEVLALYATLEDANNRVRREWEEWREAGGFGDIEGGFDGANNWWSSEDHGGEEKGIRIWVKAWNVWPAGSEPDRVWKRADPPGSDSGEDVVNGINGVDEVVVADGVEGPQMEDGGLDAV